ncbi:MAG: aldose 1-epimerase [Proteobacteria bacterium]|nr:aldose 1-epimerase [Pseudomonadota bacterium]
MTVLSLKNGRLAVDLAPSSGGAIAAFRVDGVDVLRPMAAADIASGKGNNGSAYPLVPFSNRIANGRLDFEGETFQLAQNWPGVNHPMHGDGWSHAWQVERADATFAEIAYVHDPVPQGWPFRYRARQAYRLDADRLTVAMAIDNIEQRAVPAGLGLHPFFVRDTDSELQCRTEAVWRTNAEVLPIARIVVPPAYDFSRSRNVNDVTLDNCFDGWDGRATIRWPSRKLRLVIEASSIFRHVVIYVPPGKPYFCVEPVSHANGRVGRTHLDAGATLSGEIVFRVEQES